ncbi:MAG: putative LPS assembly protein LptD [Candidatus Cloacimonetes bacterium]|jgi:lipopolysaccharide assembly outer membrane protein LptD (OstA)
MKKFILFLLILSFPLFLILFAQNNGNNLSLQQPEVSPDTLIQAPVKEDSLFYAADSVSYYQILEQINLYGNTEIRYQNFVINSDSIILNLKTNRAYSNGNTVMKDGEQILLGSNVVYDIETQTGIMEDGVSSMDKSFYSGKQVRKIDVDTYDVDDCNFTTCEYAEPDFWFSAKQVRIYNKDKIVGKNVVAYVNHLPIFYFPFIIIPIHRGRHPGFLIPVPGYNVVDGKFLKDIAWYYPYKDYADIIVSFDLYEKTGWKAALNLNYLQRYYLNGYLDAAFQKKITDMQTYNDWSVRANHHQELGNKATFDLNIDFVSNKRIWEGSSDINESLAQTITSSVSYRQPLLTSYLNIGSTYTEDLINDRASISLPTATFSLPSRPVYEIFYHPERSPDAWWSNISYNYNVRFDHIGLMNAPHRDFLDYIWANEPDPENPDYLLTQHNAGIKHQLGLSYSWKALGWLNFQHGLTYNEAWFDRDKNGNKWVRGNDYYAYTNTNFNVYGVRTFQDGWLKSIRHLLTPSASFSLSPDFSKNSKFYSFGGIYLSNSNKSANLNLSLDQRWQIKYGNDNKKINDLIGLRSGISANLVKKDHPFGNISHSAYFRPGSFNLGTFHMPGTKYKLDKISLAYSAQYSLYHNPYQMHLLDWKPTNQYFSQALTLTGSAPYEKYFIREKNKIFDPYQTTDTLQVFAEDITALGGQDNWRISLSHDLSASKSLADPVSQNIRLDSTFKITQNWSVSYGNYINLKTGKMLYQTLHIIRDLHCWKIDLSYSRRNEYWEYKIALFNVVFPDALRFQTHDSRRS